MEKDRNEQCPQPGLCLELKSDVAAMKAEANIRNSSADGLRKWLLSLVGLGLVQLCGFIWLASSINATVQLHTIQLADHETRIRMEERVK